MAKKKEPMFWSVSANGKSTSGGSAYGKRNKRKQASGQGCVITFLAGGGLLAGLAYAASEAARWVL